MRSLTWISIVSCTLLIISTLAIAQIPQATQFTLGLDETVVLPYLDTRVTLTDIQDGRCPLGAYCFAPDTFFATLLISTQETNESITTGLKIGEQMYGSSPLLGPYRIVFVSATPLKTQEPSSEPLHVTFRLERDPTHTLLTVSDMRTILRPFFPFIDVTEVFSDSSSTLSVSGNVPGRLLAVFPIRIPVHITLDKETFMIKQTLFPWWKILVVLPQKQPTMHFDTLDKGTYSSVTTPQTIVLRSSQDARTFSRTGIDSFDTIDFSQKMIVGVFQGEHTTGGYTITITRIEETPTHMIAFVEETRPRPADLVTEALTQPYHIVSVEATQKPVVFVFSEAV